MVISALMHRSTQCRSYAVYSRATSHEPVAGHRGAPNRLDVRYHTGRNHLPFVAAVPRKHSLYKDT